MGTALEALGPGVSHGLATKLSAGVQSSQGFTREGSTSKLTHVAAGRIQFLAGWWLVATLGSMRTSPKGSSQHGSLLHQRDQARRAKERKCKQGASCRVCFFKYIYFCMCCIIHPYIHTYLESNIPLLWLIWSKPLSPAHITRVRKSHKGMNTTKWQAFRVTVEHIYHEQFALGYCVRAIPWNRDTKKWRQGGLPKTGNWYCLRI